MCAHSTGHLYYFLFTPCSRFHPFAPSSLHLSYSTRLIPLSPSFVAVYFFFFALPVVASIFFSLFLFFIPSLSLSQRVKERGRRVATIVVGRSAFSLSIRPGHPVVFGLFPAYPFTFDLSWLSRTALRGLTPRIILVIVGK